MKVLIGYDGSECANSAIEDLKLAGLGEDVQARVVSVADVFPHLTSEFFEDGKDPVRETSHLVRQAKSLARHALAEARSLAKEGALRVREQFPKWNVEDHAIGDSPYWALVKEATAWQADLIIVGSHGRNAVTRALIGGVSAQTIAYAPCSVRVGRAPRHAGSPITLLLGTDFSAAADLVVAKVSRRSWPAGTKVLFVAAIDSQVATALPAIVDGEDSIDEEAAAKNRMQPQVEMLSRGGLAVTTVCVFGNPRRIILKEADQQNVDAIFIGAKGLTRVKHVLLGSVATSIANRASCSVEVVR